MTTKEDTIRALNSIRALIDTDVSDSDISQVKIKAMKLSSMYGTAAEAYAFCVKMLGKEELEAMTRAKEIGYSTPQMVMKYVSCSTSETKAMLEYADSLSSAITHTLDTLRTIISHDKAEMETSLKA